MIEYMRTRAAAKRARRAYELVVLEGLIAENRRQMEKRADLDVCKWCEDIEPSAQRGVCASA